jgi:hypothetical protein
MNYLKFSLWIFLSAWLVISPASELIGKQLQQGKHQTHQSKQQKKHVRPFVSPQNYQTFWDQGTFPTRQASIDYHTKKHGNGRSQLHYTRDAVNFYAKYRHLQHPFTLQDGSQGYKIKKGTEGGIWTKKGKIVTFWG